VADGAFDAWLVPPDNPPKRVADKRRTAMRLSALFEEFVAFLRVEQEAARRTVSTYRWCFSDFMEFSRRRLGDTVLVAHFTSELCRAYHYDLSGRGLQTNSIRVRLATLGSFGKWAVRHDRLEALGQDSGLPELHPHAFRHSCGVELLRRTRGNLRAVQEHLRHQDIQTTTIYTRLTQHELEQIVSVFDGNGKGVLIPSPRDQNFGAKTA
jgi:site-specific recombinase XerD